MDILARQMTVDMYNCKASSFDDMQSLLSTIKTLLSESDLEILSTTSQAMPDGHFSLMLLYKSGHIAVHVFPALGYASLDVFMCQEDAAPEKVFATIHKLFKPEKTKTTVLKRGDFGKTKDMKPKTKTKVAPLRKIHNTGSKVIKMLKSKDNKND